MDIVGEIYSVGLSDSNAMLISFDRSGSVKPPERCVGSELQPCAKVYAVEFSHRSGRDLTTMAKKRSATPKKRLSNSLVILSFLNVAISRSHVFFPCSRVFFDSNQTAALTLYTGQQGQAGA